MEPSLLSVNTSMKPWLMMGWVKSLPDPVWFHVIELQVVVGVNFRLTACPSVLIGVREALDEILDNGPAVAILSSRSKAAMV